jgi:4-hydroxybenzoyl-CoA thioesterase/acyl-CoA thioester hydrolase
LAAFHTARRVEFRDTDAAGIMHFSTFFNRMEEAEHELLRTLGTSVFTYAFVFSCRNEPVATGRMTVVHCRVPSDAPPAPEPMPEELRAKLAQFADPEAT